MEIIVKVATVPGVGRAVYSLLKSGVGYGISVRLPERGDACEVRDICTDSSAALELFRLVVEGTVTPATLCDVVYDWLCR